MSLKKIDEVKADKGFKLLDIIIYGIIIAIVAALFITLFATRDEGALRGIRIYVRSVAVFEYDFSNGSYNVLEDAFITVEEGTPLTVRVNTADGGYNLVQMDPVERTVKVVEADCGRLDCVYTPAISDNNGIIYCSPHFMRILPYDFENDDGYIIM